MAIEYSRQPPVEWTGDQEFKILVFLLISWPPVSTTSNRRSSGSSTSASIANWPAS